MCLPPSPLQSRLPQLTSLSSTLVGGGQSGAAGTPAALRRGSPIVELSMLLAECVQVRISDSIPT